MNRCLVSFCNPKSVPLFTALVFCFGYTWRAEAQTVYKFTNIADNSANSLFGAFEPECFTINSSGQVAFAAPLKGGGRAVYKWAGGTLTKIAKTPDIPTLGQFASIDFLGEVAYNGSYNQNAEIINKSNGTSDKLVTGYFYYDLTSPSISSDGKVAWTGFNGFQSTGGGTSTDTSRYYVLRNPESGATGQNKYGAIIAHTGAKGNDLNGYFSGFTLANVSDSGTVVFHGSIRSGGEGIFIGKDPLADERTPGNTNTTKVADSVSAGSNFSGFSNRPDINNSDTVAFGAQLKTGGRVICKWNRGGTPSIVLDDTGPYSFIGLDPAINDAGTLAFVANVRKTGTGGIFTGPDPVVDAVIQTGASLFGSTVTKLGGGARSLNNKAQLVFLYELADGRKGLALAEPDGTKKPTGDLAIKQEKQAASAYSTRGVFLRGAAGSQLKEVSFEPAVGSSSVFNVELTNTASEAKTYAFHSAESGDTGWKVQAFYGTTDYWSQMKSPGILSPLLQPGGKMVLRVVVTGADATKALPYNTKHGFIIAVTSSDDQTFTHDAVGANVETVKALVVNSTGDESAVNPSVGPDSNKSKPGDQITLRSAIQYANAHIGKDIIKFKIPDNDPGKQNGVWLIKPHSGLPAITEPVTIDGRTQSPDSTTPTIELDGSLVTRPPLDQSPTRPRSNIPFDIDDHFVEYESGFTWDDIYQYRQSWPGAASGLTCAPGSDESEIYRLAVTSFPLFGLELRASSITVQSCHVGIDAQGLRAAANGYPSRRRPENPHNWSVDIKTLIVKGGGILIRSSSNHIGGANGETRNVISGISTKERVTQEGSIAVSQPAGILISGEAASNNVIEGNYFGVDRTGEALPLQADSAGADFNPDAEAGVVICQAQNNTIGGSSAGAGNVFAGHSIVNDFHYDHPADGIRVVGSAASRNFIAGNIFGASASRAKDLKLDAGVRLEGPANFIGAPISNFIGSCNNGLFVAQPDNMVQDNVFESAKLATGIYIDGTASKTQVLRNRISGADEAMFVRGFGNEISNNEIVGCFSGISVSGATPTVVYVIGEAESIRYVGGGGNRIERNKIHDITVAAVEINGSIDNGVQKNRISGNSLYNCLKGIDLALPGKPTLNDPGDNDSGGNDRQNFPLLFKAAITAGGAVIEGTLRTTSGSRNYRVELFASRRTGGEGNLGYGEGERFLGSIDVTTNFNGEADFVFNSPSSVSPREFISATATDPDGNTSELSKSILGHTGHDVDRDGVDDEVESGVPGRNKGNSAHASATRPAILAASADGDGNGDGIADWQQNNVASLVGVSGKWITLASPSGVDLINVEPTGPPDLLSLPDGYDFPVGFLSFTAAGIKSGASIQISEIFHDAEKYTTVFAYGPTPDNSHPHWYHFLFDGSTGADLSKAGQITFTFKDGARGDHDLKANGQITTILAPAVSTTSLLNISTRMRVLTGENVLIGGFIISGPEPKKVMVRGLGPSLGLNSALLDPTLELHDSSGPLAANDNWKQSQEAEIRATGIPPTNDADSALVRTLNPTKTGFGAYTAVLRGNGNTSGIGLLELYDLAQSANSRLVNISTRGFVDSGDNVMIGGFIVGGAADGGAKVAIRAIGPSLARAGIQGSLQDPTLELHDGNGAILAKNDNWKETQQHDLAATGIAPSDDRESAILSTLKPGNYTAIVRGKNNTTGVGLVEVYNLQ